MRSMIHCSQCCSRRRPRCLLWNGGYYQSLEDKAQADIEDYKKYAKYLETIIANNQQDVLAIINTLNADAGIAASAISSAIQTDHQISEHMAPRA